MKTKKTAKTARAGKVPKAAGKAMADKLASRRALSLVVSLAIIGVFAATIGILVVTRDKDAATLTPEQYREQLQGQVEAADGSPNSGRDPASQGQASLSDAASKPNGAGARTDTPAAGVTGNHSAHHPEGTDNAAQSGINTAGCYFDYGKQGQECLPAHAAGDDGKLTCGEVRQHFADGILVTGTDRFGLDKNGDKIACGSGD